MMIHPTAEVSPRAVIGFNTRVSHRAQICEGACVGDECVIGSQVYIDHEVVIGNRVKILTAAQLYRGAVVEDGVFVGPSVCLTNDKYPRAITPDGRLKSDADGMLGRIHVRYGASLGAASIVLANVTVGRFAMVTAGAVVNENVPDHGLVVGVPARLVSYVCACGQRLKRIGAPDSALWECPLCGSGYLTQPDDGLYPVFMGEFALRLG